MLRANKFSSYIGAGPGNKFSLYVGAGENGLLLYGRYNSLTELEHERNKLWAEGTVTFTQLPALNTETIKSTDSAESGEPVESAAPSIESTDNNESDNKEETTTMLRVESAIIESTGTDLSLQVREIVEGDFIEYEVAHNGRVKIRGAGHVIGESRGRFVVNNVNGGRAYVSPYNVAKVTKKEASRV